MLFSNKKVLSSCLNLLKDLMLFFQMHSHHILLIMFLELSTTMMMMTVDDWMESGQEDVVLRRYECNQIQHGRHCCILYQILLHGDPQIL